MSSVHPMPAKTSTIYQPKTVTKDGKTVPVDESRRERCGRAWRSCGSFLHNRTEGTYLGRTPTDWWKILLFYAVFYGILAGFFALMLWVFLSTLSVARPKWQDIIGESPGLAARPTPNDRKNHLISFQPNRILDVEGGDQDNYHVKDLTTFLSAYSAANQQGDNYMDCTKDNHPGHPPGQPEKVCRFTLESTDFGPCQANNAGYGYQSGKPCVVLKINKLHDFTPIGYSSSDLVPDELKGFELDENQLVVTCRAAKPGVVIGEVKIFPPSIPTWYFPYKNQKGYLSPFVMVQFTELPEQLVDVTCRAWMKNAEEGGSHGHGLVRFQIHKETS